MSKINQIENAILELDGGVFQKLANAYLICEGYDGLNAIGSVVGSNKVSKGTPDAAFILENKKYVFVEHTTQRTNLCSKIKSDIIKCLNEEKTGVSLSQIEKIIYCFTSHISVPEQNELVIFCQESGVILELCNIDIIANNLYLKHPFLAKEFLGIEVDTGQILPIRNFIKTYQKNALATRLDLNLVGRDDERTQLKSALNSSNLVVVSGVAGIGKTRLVLDICQNFETDNIDWSVYCVFKKGLNIFEDIKAYFSKTGNFLIFVDDANRISSFEYFIDLLQHARPDQKIKIIVTVRSYALNTIQNYNSALKENVSYVDLQGLKEDDIRQLISENYDITNPRYLDRICEISKDNPRLSVMAAEVVKQNKNYESIRNVSELYHQYFSSIVLDLEKDNSNLKDSTNLQVAAIISFFNTVDTTSQQQMDLINNHFKITKKVFLEAANKLFELEIVDIYENEVIKVSDQILATYLFYLCFFKEKSLDISRLFEIFEKNYMKKFQESIYSISNIFGIEIVKERISPIVHKFMKEKIIEEQLEFFRIFWFIDIASTLVCVSEYIDKIDDQLLEGENYTEDHVVSLLAQFQHAEKEDFYTALELIFKFLEKRPDCIGSVIKLFTENFNFSRNSHLEAYENQVLVLEFLDSLVGQSNRFAMDIFFEVAKSWLNFEFKDTYSKGNQFFINRFFLLKSKVVFKIRKIIWHRLYSLYLNEVYRDRVIGVYEAYVKFHSVDKNILRYDLRFLLNFFDKELLPDNYTHCKLVRSFLKNIEKQHGLSYGEVFDKFSKFEFEIFNILLTQYFDLYPVVEYDQFDQYRIDSISKLVGQASDEKLKNWFDEIGSWNTAFINNDGQNNCKLGGLLLRAIELKKPLSTYLEMLCYWEKITEGGVEIFYSVKFLLKKLGYSKFICFIRKSSLNNKNVWFFEILSQQSEIDNSQVKVIPLPTMCNQLI
jgi:hypothetical protein